MAENEKSPSHEEEEETYLDESGVDANGNENCLVGMQCPKCEQCESFGISVRTIVEMFDNGSGDHQDLEYDDDDWAECTSCNYEGTVGTFKEGYRAVQKAKAKAGPDPDDAHDPKDLGGPFGS
jgi:hypothetical protein